MYQAPPCTRGWPCEAYCCGIFTLWDRDSFRKAERDGIFRQYRCKIMKFVGSHNKGYYIFPHLEIFKGLGEEVTDREIERCMYNAFRYALKKRIKWIRCVFLDRYNKCGIYEHRPNACRIFGTSLSPDCPLMEGGTLINI